MKVAVESVIQSESVVAESKKPEAQQTVSQAQPDAAQGNHFLINLVKIYFAVINNETYCPDIIHT